VLKKKEEKRGSLSRSLAGLISRMSLRRFWGEVICGGYVLSGAFNAICNKQFYKLFRYLDHIIRTYGTKKRTI
jgi:hypothetical protein